MSLQGFDFQWASNCGWTSKSRHTTQQTQNICWANVEDVGSTSYKCYANVLTEIEHAAFLNDLFWVIKLCLKLGRHGKIQRTIYLIKQIS